MEARSWLLALGVLVGGLVVGAAVMAIGRPMLGMLLGLASVPVALLVWLRSD